MLDTAVRRRIAPPLEAAAGRLAALGVRADHVTGAGLLLGVGACVAAGFGAWGLAAALFLLNRTLDGLDGALARLAGPTPLGGLLDFLADFVVYGGFVLGVAIALPDTRVAACFLLAAYLLNIVLFSTLGELLSRVAPEGGDERGLRFTAALTEGVETIAAYVVVCAWPSRAEIVFWVFGAMVLVSVAQRLVAAQRLLRISDG